MNEKIELLAKVILATADIYNKSDTKARQKSLMETIIGAGIFYLPMHSEYYNGYTSKNAIKALKNNPKTKLVKEHFFPRKVAGNKCYSTYFSEIKNDINNFEILYKNILGKWNYVLQDENNALKKHQKDENFIDSETSYINAGIDLVEITLEEIKRLQRL